MPFFVPQRELDLRDQMLADLRSDRAALAARVAEMERQVDALHQQGFVIPPAPPPEVRPMEYVLPQALEEVAAGMGASEDRDAWREVFRAKLEAGITEDAILAEMRTV